MWGFNQKKGSDPQINIQSIRYFLDDTKNRYIVVGCKVQIKGVDNYHKNER